MMRERGGTTVVMNGSVTRTSLRYAAAHDAGATEKCSLRSARCVINDRQCACHGACACGLECDIDRATRCGSDARTAAIVALAKFCACHNAYNIERGCAVIVQGDRQGTTCFANKHGAKKHACCRQSGIG